MKFFVSFLLTGLLSYTATLFANETPWWMFAPGAFLAGWVVPAGPFKSWLAGFSSVFILWAVLCFLTDKPNNSLLSAKMASILPLQGSSVSLILVSAFIGGLVAGMAALTGAFMRKKPAI